MNIIGASIVVLVALVSGVSGETDTVVAQPINIVTVSGASGSLA